MTCNLQVLFYTCEMQVHWSRLPPTARFAVVLSAMAIGRAMTLPFIARSGDGGPGDPPGPWLMPLVGDAAIGLAAIGVVALLLLRLEPLTWMIAVTWSAVAAFDAVAALLVELRSPWPDFFMLEVFGRSMFVAAVGLQLVIIGLLATDSSRNAFGVPRVHGHGSATIHPRR